MASTLPDAPGLRAVASLGERKLEAQMLAKRYRHTKAFGDDCAVVPKLPQGPFELVATTDPCPDPLVAALGWDRRYYQGWLLGTINFSDLAAAGAEPLGLVVSYLVPRDLPVDHLNDLIDGVDDCCRAHCSEVIGGNLGDFPVMQLTATAIGACAVGKRLSRTGARPGDVLLLVGSAGYLWSTALLKKGYAALGDGLDEAERKTVFERALTPVAQLRAGRLLADAGLATAAIDNSDGLFASVETLCRASRVQAVIEAGAPFLDPLPSRVCALAGVDPFALGQLWGDWTLLVAVPEDATDPAMALLGENDLACRRIGFLREGTHSVLRRGGEDSRWKGTDPERFTERSWHSSQLDGYLADLASVADPCS